MPKRGRPSLISPELLVILKAVFDYCNEKAIWIGRKLQQKDLLKQILKAAGLTVDDKPIDYFVDNLNTLMVPRMQELEKDPEAVQKVDEYVKLITKSFEEQQNKQKEELNLQPKETLALVPVSFYASFKDLLQNRYTVANINEIWTIDETERGKVFVTFILDLASRKILKFRIYDHNITSAEVIELINATIEEYGVCKCFHSDAGGPFTANATRQFLYQKGIAQSIGGIDTKIKFSNQVSENTNRRLWEILECVRHNHEGMLFWDTLSFVKQVELISAAIQCLNHDPKLFKVGREVMYDLLKHNPYYPSIVTSSTSDIATEINKHKRELAKNYLTQAPIDPEVVMDVKLTNVTLATIQQQIVQSSNTVIQSLSEQLDKSRKEQADILLNSEKRQKEMQEQFNNNILAAQENYAKELERFKAALDELREQNQELIEEKRARLENERLKQHIKKNRKHQPLRDEITPEDFKVIIERVKGRTSYVIARDRVALILLFFTGLRIANLQTVTFGNIRQFLLNKQSISIRLIKTRGQVSVMTFQYATAYTPFVKLIKKDIEAFCEGQPFDKLAFDLNMKTYLTRLNKYLRAAGVLLEKNLKTHSFRVGVVTRIASVGGRETAKDFIGHKNTTTTARYDRNKISGSRRRELINQSFSAFYDQSLESQTQEDEFEEEGEANETEANGDFNSSL